MKAAIYNKYGSPDVLEIVDLIEPEIQDGEILIRVKYASVNPIDWKIRKGVMKIITGNKFPRITGSDFMGFVEDSNDNNFQKGDAVFGYVDNTKQGSCAELVKVTEENLIKIPVGIDEKQAAVIPLAASTALESLLDKAKISIGRKVFINGGTGGVGSFAIQIAKYYNCEVTTTCSTKSIAYAKDFGADHIIDYTKEPLFDNKKYDIILDAVSNLSIGMCRKYMNKKGVFITLKPRPIPMLKIFFNNLISSKKGKIELATPNKKTLNRLQKLITETKLKPYIDKSYNLDNIAEAHRYSELGRTKGKILIEI